MDVLSREDNLRIMKNVSVMNVLNNWDGIVGSLPMSEVSQSYTNTNTNTLTLKNRHGTIIASIQRPSYLTTSSRVTIYFIDPDAQLLQPHIMIDDGVRRVIFQDISFKTVDVALEKASKRLGELLNDLTNLTQDQ